MIYLDLTYGRIMISQDRYINLLNDWWPVGLK